MARQEALPVADGADRADGVVRDAAAGVDVQPVGLARGGAGAVLDRADSALHPAACPGPALRPGRAEPARRGDGAAGERQVLPLLHLHLHPVPVRQRDLGRLPVHRVRPELAGIRRRTELAGQDRSGAVGGRARRGRHQHRARDGSQEGRTRAVVVENHAGADVLRPLLHRAQPRPPRAGGHPGGSRVGPLRRDLLGVPAAQRVGQPEILVGAGSCSVCVEPARVPGTGPTTC